MPDNKSKIIWYCHPYAGAPSLGMSYRPYYLTREFSKAGHNAFVIAASFHHLLRDPIEQSTPVRLCDVDGVSFITLKTRTYQGNGAGRFANMLEYARRFKKHFKAILALTGKPDVIIVSSAHPFHYPVLAGLAKRLKAKLIFEVRDLWPKSLQELMNIPAWHPLVLWLAYIEKRALRNADEVVTVLNGAFPYMRQKGLSKERFHVIPNGTSLDETEAKASVNDELLKLIQDKKRAGQFLIGYAGALGRPNAMQYFLEAFVILAAQKKPMHAFIVGEGHLKNELIAFAKSHQLDNVTFYPAIPKAQVQAFLNQMDALYLGWNQAEIYRYGVSPNKMFDYMRAARPILESGGAKTGIVDETGCGFRCEAENPAAIAGLVTQVMALSEAERDAMGQKGFDEIHKKYDYQILARQYAALF